MGKSTGVDIVIKEDSLQKLKLILYDNVYYWKIYRSRYCNKRRFTLKVETTNTIMKYIMGKSTGVDIAIKEVHSRS